MHELKYIIVIDGVGREQAIVFPPAINHRNAAGRHRVYGAGFCRLPSNGQSATAYGESESLGIQSRGETDAAIINQWFKT